METAKRQEREPSLPDLRDKDAIMKYVRSEAAPFVQRVLFRLGEWKRQIDTSFDDRWCDEWPEKERLAYLEQLGRLVARPISVPPPLIAAETRRLAEALSNHKDEGIRAFLRLVALAWAPQTDTNMSDGKLERMHALKKMAADYLTRGQTVEAMTLVNPFRLAKGEKLFLQSYRDSTLTTETILDIEIEGTEGLVTTDKEVYELDDINDQIAWGSRATERADSNFIDPDELRQRKEFVDQFTPGSVFTMTVNSFLSPPTTLKVRCLGSNKDALREKFGDAYLSQIGWSCRLFRVSLERVDETGNKFSDTSYDPVSSIIEQTFVKEPSSDS